VTRQASPDDTRRDARLRQYPSDRERRGRRPELGREDALGQARTIEALYRSAEERRVADLD